jgi:hypothetical protein
MTPEPKQMVLTLEDVIELATDSSLNAFIAEKQKSNADTLLNLGLKRFELASISRSEA